MNTFVCMAESLYCPPETITTLLTAMHMPARLLQSCLTLPPHGLQPAELLGPWDSPGKNTGVDCHALLQGIIPNPGIEPASLMSPPLTGGFFTTSATWAARIGYILI